MINIIGGIIPTLIWIVIILLLDKNRKTRDYKKYILLFLLGGIGSYLCYRLELHYGSYFKKVKNSNYWEILFYAIFGVAIFEEGYKWLITILPLIKNPTKKALELFYQSIYVSLGFCTIENILFYAIPYGGIVAISRISSAYLSHLINAIWMGYFLEKAKTKKRIINLSLSLITPIIIHAIYNSFLYGNKYSMYFSYAFTIIIVSGIIIIIQVKKKGEENGI